MDATPDKVVGGSRLPTLPRTGELKNRHSRYVDAPHSLTIPVSARLNRSFRRSLRNVNRRAGANAFLGKAFSPSPGQ